MLRRNQRTSVEAVLVGRPPRNQLSIDFSPGRSDTKGAEGEMAGAARKREAVELPDNTPDGLKALRDANDAYRAKSWPKPYNATTHRLHLGDARDLSWLPNESVDLVVTSPPYWTLKKYETRNGQLGDVADYEAFLGEIDRVWRDCGRVLVPGGRICCVVGDVCVPRKRHGRHFVMPLHADIQVRARSLGLDNLTPILWHKIANGVTEAEGNGAGFYGKPYQPGAVVKNDVEYILFLRKGHRLPISAAHPQGAVDADADGDAGVVSVVLVRHSRRIDAQRPPCPVSGRAR